MLKKESDPEQSGEREDEWCEWELRMKLKTSFKGKLCKLCKGVQI